MISNIIDFISSEALILLASALLFSAGGFYRVVYFISTGYAFSIAGMAQVSFFLLFDSIHLLVLVQLILLLAYGARLGIFLVRREFKPSYQKEMGEIYKQGAALSIFKKAMIWLGVSVLYLLMFSPGLFNLQVYRETGAVSSYPLLITGTAVMAFGLLLESVADWQKSAFKKANPGDYCYTGLFRLVRCPNYLGEVIFWIGNWVAGLGAYLGWGRWAVSLAGLICIILIMIGSTRRLERKQLKKYGKRKAYHDYCTGTPILLPFVPLYSLQKVKVYLG